MVPIAKVRLCLPNRVHHELVFYLGRGSCNLVEYFTKTSVVFGKMADPILKARTYGKPPSWHEEVWNMRSPGLHP